MKREALPRKRRPAAKAAATRGVHHLALNTEDMRTTVDFYTRVVGMPLVHDEASGLWCLGPESGGRALTSATAPELVLPDLDGTLFSLSALRGTKVVLVAWASW